MRRGEYISNLGPKGLILLIAVSISLSGTHFCKEKRSDCFAREGMSKRSVHIIELSRDQKLKVEKIRPYRPKSL